jgi:hypothetical protein
VEFKQADFCRTYGMEPSTVSKAIKRGDLTRNTAGLIDDENTTNKLFLAKHRFKAAAPAIAAEGRLASTQVPPPASKPLDFSAFDDYEIADHAGLPQKLLNMSIHDLVVKFRGLEGIEAYIKMLRDLTAADEKEQRVRERRLQLVEKDFMRRAVFAYLDALNKQQLEWPESEVDRIIALVQSEGAAARRDVVRIMEKGISDIIKDAKSHIDKEFSGLRVKYQEDEDKLDEVKAAIEEAVGD